ncbi:MAG: dihydroorotase, partial [Gemmatimonadetes bacterium]|nr:dihydroorotase [Gemmatimonadota bacterium]NIS00252.1 dihydroorotase [Gemmatimonadota bacterium]NIT65871.1 dihydroorotase [Gemmatimonadota bacterium]NIU53235.1 dihydroorotase [Gemmatimonadota bacterium]NIV22491.1 dihydroorotase [Gemmatimonadota bacterium]
MSRPILLQGGRVIDPSQGLDAVRDLLIVDGRIAGTTDRPPEGTALIDCTGLVVAPGLVDLHVHFREPGDEHKET